MIGNYALPLAAFDLLCCEVHCAKKMAAEDFDVDMNGTFNFDNCRNWLPSLPCESRTTTYGLLLKWTKFCFFVF